MLALSCADSGFTGTASRVSLSLYVFFSITNNSTSLGKVKFSALKHVKVKQRHEAPYSVTDATLKVVNKPYIRSCVNNLSFLSNLRVAIYKIS